MTNIRELLNLHVADMTVEQKQQVAKGLNLRGYSDARKARLDEAIDLEGYKIEQVVAAIVEEGKVFEADNDDIFAAVMNYISNYNALGWIVETISIANIAA